MLLLSHQLLSLILSPRVIFMQIHRGLCTFIFLAASYLEVSNWKHLDFPFKGLHTQNMLDAFHIALQLEATDLTSTWQHRKMLKTVLSERAGKEN